MLPSVALETNDSRLIVVENFSTDLYDKVKSLSVQHEPEIMIAGRVCRQRRDVGFFSNSSKGYAYSGTLMKSQPLDSFLQEILDDVNYYLETSFNGILVNVYRNGEHYLSAHSDNERGLDKNRKMVAGISYGAVRTFRIRESKSRKIVLDLQPKPGTLIIMEGEFQREFLHEIPQQKKVKEERISLTFRKHEY